MSHATSHVTATYVAGHDVVVGRLVTAAALLTDESYARVVLLNADEWQPGLAIGLMKAAGLILISDTLTHHAAVIAREIHLPCAVVDPVRARHLAPPGVVVTLLPQRDVVEWEPR